MSRKPKKIKDDEVPYEALVEGVSSAHSWIKSNTMLRPTKLGKKKASGGGINISDINNAQTNRYF